MSRAPRVNTNNWIPVTTIAGAAGVTPDSVTMWTRNNHPNSLRKLRGRNHISLTAADAYLNRLGVPRTGRRPTGWLSVKQALARIGCSTMWLYPRIRKPDIRTIATGKMLFIHPEDVELLRTEWRDRRPLPGWILTTDVHQAAGVSKEALNAWIRRNSIKTRNFAHPTLGRLTPYLTLEDAKHYLRISSARAGRHVGHTWAQPGFTPRQRTYRLLRRSKQPLTVHSIAKQLEVHEASVRRDLRILIAAQRIARTGKGVAHHPYQYWSRE